MPLTPVSASLFSSGNAIDEDGAAALLTALCDLTCLERLSLRSVAWFIVLSSSGACWCGWVGVVLQWRERGSEGLKYGQRKYFRDTDFPIRLLEGLPAPNMQPHLV